MPILWMMAPQSNRWLLHSDPARAEKLSEQPDGRPYGQHSNRLRDVYKQFQGPMAEQRFRFSVLLPAMVCCQFCYLES